MQEDVYEAEVLPDSENTTLNITLGATLAFSIAFLLLSTNITVEIDENASLESVGEWWQVPLHDRHKMDLDLTQERSVLPVNGTYGVLTYT